MRDQFLRPIFTPPRVASLYRDLNYVKDAIPAPKRSRSIQYLFPLRFDLFDKNLTLRKAREPVETL